MTAESAWPMSLDQGFAGARLGPSQNPLDLRERLLYGVEIGRVERQVDELASPPFDQLLIALSPLWELKLPITIT